ncbi:MAG: tetratricopeptide repeat protein [Candidatus Pacebacteria bacterium]|nr:tetratricopeptide repeat protein [Candidatus Paceibacterota bacterium]
MFNFRKSKTDNSSEISVKADHSKFSAFLLSGLVLLIPIFFIPFPSFSFYFSKGIMISLVVMVLVVIWLLDRLKDSEFTYSKNPVLLTAIVLPIVYLISSLLSGAVTTSFIGQGFEIGTSLYVLVFFLLMFLTSSIVKTKERAYYLFFLFFISFFLVAIYQGLRLLIGPEFLNFGVLTSSSSNLIGKWNELSVFFGLTTILSLVTVEFVNQSKLIKFLSYIVLLISLFFVALVNFNTVWIVLGIFSFVLVAYVISANKFSIEAPAGLKMKRIPAISFLVMVLAVAIVLGNYGDRNTTDNVSLGETLGSYFEISSSELKLTPLGTWNIAKETLKTKSALLGAGPNRFVNQWLKYKPASLNNTQFWNVDFNSGYSFILSSVVTVGLLGFVLWIIFLGMLFTAGFKAVFLPKTDKAEGYLLPLAFLTTVYLWLFSIVYIPSHTILTLTFVFTGVLIALLIQNGIFETRKISFAKNQKHNFVLVLVLIFLILVSLVTGYTVIQKFSASAYSQKGLLELNKEGAVLDDVEAKIIKAVNLSNGDAYYRFLSELALVKLQNLMSKTDLSEEEVKAQFQTILGQAVENAVKSTQIDPTNYQNWVSLGRVYETIIMFDVQGAYEQAVNSYLTAINLNPQNPALAFTLGVLEYNTKNYNNAVIALERAVILQPYYSDAKYFLGLTYYNLDRVDDAILQFKDLEMLNPESAEIKAVLENLEAGATPFAGFKNASTLQEDVIEEEPVVEEDSE